jgi:hypothetical protein
VLQPEGAEHGEEEDPARPEQPAEGQRVGGGDPLPGAFREAERFLRREGSDLLG